MKSHSIFACLPGPHCLTSTSSADQSQLRAAGLEPQDTSPPHPPAVEVFLADVVKSKPFTTDPVNLQGGLVLLKGRVHSTDILGFGSTDLVPGKYEGGLKLWECAIDLVNILQGEIKDGRLSFRGKRVLELGCGHGLPGIYACLKGASLVHFQDFNVEVLRSLTIPNVNANLEMARSRQSYGSDSGQPPTKAKQLSPDVHFYAGDWEDMSNFLSVVWSEPDEQAVEDMGKGDLLEGDSLQENLIQDTSGKHDNSKPSKKFIKKHTRKLSGSRACEKGTDDAGILEGGYDIILMSETVYSMSSLPRLLALIKKCLRPPYGVIYLAGKKHYFGVGGGTRPFKNMVEEDGCMGAHLVAEFADGSSNVREIWKFFYR
ncbi:hypothetical protein GOP47_0010831 [Adiantum capillus-veneris]|uniref:protein-histidine N-methyltransferase n=2 Tax=Euphyllophyta TaxID=78536 RepID=A0A9D4UW15_ADICA|nr:hypothetical protein GOP47_0010831 [Adiantum capillus-veneris]